MSPVFLKRKDSRLRDWNAYIGKYKCRLIATWKEKILDYEIETSYKYTKQGWTLTLKRKDSRLRDWNVPAGRCSPSAWLTLEKKRFSITRLKPHYRRETLRVQDAWKEKILDYEIETHAERLACDRVHWWTWKEKILDYEIETTSAKRVPCAITPLKRKDSRLRDWNCFGEVLGDVGAFDLKRKDSRLRDRLKLWRTWWMGSAFWLEKKRFSITRLKPDWRVSWLPQWDLFLKRKDSRLRDWNIVCPYFPQILQ